MSEILKFLFFLLTNTKKLDLLRDRLIEIFRTLLFPLHARERERESKKSKKRSFREFRDEEVTQSYIYT